MNSLELISAVGNHKPNLRSDVRSVQRLLNKQALATHVTLVEDGVYGPRTQSAILAFQRKVLGIDLPDGVVDVHGITILRLQSTKIAAKLAPPPVPTAQEGKLQALSNGDYIDAAATLLCEVAAIQAVAAVETGSQGAFDSQGRPTILFERHIFSRLTSHVYDKTHPDISNKKAGGYGTFGEQYDRLNRAYKLDPDAALESASWGAFQIMGSNYKLVKFDSVNSFVAAMRRSIRDHLSAFVNFIRSNPKLLAAIGEKNWRTFARIYNGPKYHKNNYDTNLAKQYAHFSKR